MFHGQTLPTQHTYVQAVNKRKKEDEVNHTMQGILFCKNLGFTAIET